MTKGARIRPLDLVDFPVARPALDGLFALNGRGGARVLLEIDKLVYAIAFRETVRAAFAVFMDAPDEIVGHADIKSAVAVFREDVDIEGAHERKETPYWIPGTSPGMTRGVSERHKNLIPRPPNLRRAKTQSAVARIRPNGPRALSPQASQCCDCGLDFDRTVAVNAIKVA